MRANAESFKSWLLADRGQLELPGLYQKKRRASEEQSWYKVMCLTGVDYFSTLGYLNGRDGAISPTPLAATHFCHVGLDLDPKRSGVEERRAALGQSYRERAAVLRPLRQIVPAVDLHARKATVISVKEDIETVGRSRSIEVRAINIDPFHQPSLAYGHDKIVCKIRIKVGKVSEGCGQRHGASGVIVLVPQRYGREFRRWRNQALRLRGSTRRRETHGR